MVSAERKAKRFIAPILEYAGNQQEALLVGKLGNAIVRRREIRGVVSVALAELNLKESLEVRNAPRIGQVAPALG